MLATGAALFDLDTDGAGPDGGERVTATEHSRGPWDPSACHGGPVAALLVRSVEQLAASAAPVAAGSGGAGSGATTEWQVARTTIELVRPVPVGVPMTVGAEVERPGRNVSLVASVLRTEDGTEVARSRTLRIRTAAIEVVPTSEPERSFSGPGDGARTASTWGAGDLVAFHRDSVELRFAAGGFDERGPAKVWCRLLVPVVAGEEPSGAQRACAAADFGNGVSGEIDPDVVTFINPDLTVHLLRPVVGEWIGMDVRSHYGPFGAGMAESALYDADGRVGRSVQSLFLAPRR